VKPRPYIKNNFWRRLLLIAVLPILVILWLYSALREGAIGFWQQLDPVSFGKQLLGFWEDQSNEP
jgi:hypothetical protein